jgi:hypothetical protein
MVTLSSLKNLLNDNNNLQLTVNLLSKQAHVSVRFSCLLSALSPYCATMSIMKYSNGGTKLTILLTQYNSVTSKRLTWARHGSILPGSTKV